MRKFKLTLQGEEFYADLYEKEAPNIIAALEKVTPFKSKVIWAKVCENEIYFPTPAFAPEVENMLYAVKGNIAFFRFKQSICVWYGDTPSLGFSATFAKLKEEDIPRFAEAASRVYDDNGCIIEVDFAEQ